jgi:predicted Zn-dependent protease
VTGRSRAAAFGLLLTMGSCATNPVTGRRERSLISESQEIQMGQQIAAKSERPNLPWEFHVLDDAAVNAFACPGAAFL